ncbi:MAG: heme exporter protein CcmD [Gammaproteobacteria bacterium]|nr:MAG: heme exporter protein CcmD [Gammaproteobacteria bacterium]
MKFQFDSVDAFLKMGGHGAFVWASYVIVYAILIYLTLAPVLSKKTFLKQQKKLLHLQKKSPENSQ